jgi:chemotaxis protein MotB
VAKRRGVPLITWHAAVFPGTTEDIHSVEEDTMRTNWILLPLLFLSAGCVSTTEYRKLEDENSRLHSRHQEADQKLTALSAELDDLKQRSESIEMEKARLEKLASENSSQYENLLSKLQGEVEQGQLTIRQYKDMLTVDVAEKIFFDSGRAVLKEGGKKVLLRVGEAVKAYDDKVLRVVGHTDNVPLAKSYQKVFPSNWELSVLRATNVARFLQEEAGIPPERLVACGRGEYAPVASNATPEGRRQNRRIEIMLVDKAAERVEKEPKETRLP